MEIRVRFEGHGSLRGLSADLTLPQGSTAAQARDAYFVAHPAVAGLASVTRLASGVEYLPWDAVLADPCELHLIPPVSGG